MNSCTFERWCVTPGNGQAWRPRLVFLSVVAISAFAVGDLVLTAYSMQSIGMLEGNPLVCFLVRRSNSAAALIGFKLISNAIGAVLLCAGRRKLVSQAGSLLVAIAYAGVLVQWHRYTVSLLDAGVSDFHAATDFVQILG